MSDVSPGVRLIVLLAVWIVWWLGFAASWRRPNERAVRLEPKARWGMALSGVGYFIAFFHSPRVWGERIEMWRILAGIACAIPAAILLWSAVRNLGRQWRFDAGLNGDHELVQSGAYSLVRHPIYASMLCMLVSTLFLAGTLPGWPFALVIFIIGTEIRVRVEDGLLRERFGERFVQWQRSLPAYLPFVR